MYVLMNYFRKFGGQLEDNNPFVSRSTALVSCLPKACVTICLEKITAALYFQINADTSNSPVCQLSAEAPLY